MEGGGGKVTGTNREVEAVVAASFAARTAASIDFREHGRAQWCALTVSGQGALSIFGRPSFTPCATARLRPALMRWRIIVRSNSAKAPLAGKRACPLA